MAQKKKKLIRVRCTKCKKVNYYIWRSQGVKKYKKYCNKCKKHTIHEEKKNA